MAPDAPDRFELFVRSLEPTTAAPAHDACVEHLQRLASAGPVTFDVEVWGEALPVESPSAATPAATSLHDRVRTVRRWAAAHDAELPGFERVETDTLAGPGREALRLPALLLAAYREGELVEVAPRVEADELVTVADVVGAVDAPEGEGSVGPRETTAVAGQ